MIARSVPIRIVGSFMIIPYGDEGKLLMQAHQHRIEFDGGIPQAVICQAYDFVVRQLLTDGTYYTIFVFIDIIAQMEDRVDIIALPDGFIGIVITGWVIGTGNKGKAKLAAAAHRCRFGPACQGIYTAGGEFIKVPRIGL